MKYPWRSNVRFDPLMGEEGTFLLRCEDCATRNEGTSFWPLTREFWLPTYGLQRCKACHRAKRRGRRRQSIEEVRAKQRAHYYEIRDVILPKRRSYYAANIETIRAQRRAAYARRKARLT